MKVLTEHEQSIIKLEFKSLQDKEYTGHSTNRNGTDSVRNSLLSIWRDITQPHSEATSKDNLCLPSLATWGFLYGWIFLLFFQQFYNASNICLLCLESLIATSAPSAEVFRLNRPSYILGNPCFTTFWTYPLDCRKRNVTISRTDFQHHAKNKKSELGRE